jgi:hypothetical protein
LHDSIGSNQTVKQGSDEKKKNRLSIPSGACMQTISVFPVVDNIPKVHPVITNLRAVC